MARKRYTTEQIIGLLRQAEVMVGRGCGMEEVLREIDVTANTYYRWRKEYGGLGMDQARRLKEFEFEDFLESFDHILRRISPKGRYFVAGENMGWRHLSGTAIIDAQNARSFMARSFPKTSEWILRGQFDRKHRILTYTLSHHDAPTGEHYTVRAYRAGDIKARR